MGAPPGLAGLKTSETGHVQVRTHFLYDHDADGKVLRVAEITDYTAEQMKKPCLSTVKLRERWGS